MVSSVKKTNLSNPELIKFLSPKAKSIVSVIFGTGYASANNLEFKWQKLQARQYDPSAFLTNMTGNEESFNNLITISISTFLILLPFIKLAHQLGFRTATVK